MVNNRYGQEDAEQALSSGTADLVRRLRDYAQLNPLQEDKPYGGGAEGYTDYPTLDATE